MDKVRHHLPILLIAVILMFISACGTNIGSHASNANASSTPTSVRVTTPSTISIPQNQINIHGCPNHAVITTQPSVATVILKRANSNTPISIKKGDTIEVDLPFGLAWQGPTNLSPSLLEMQVPSGYAFPVSNMCIWRFLALGTGMATLSFTGRSLCEPNRLCPMDVLEIPFILNIT